MTQTKFREKIKKIKPIIKEFHSKDLNIAYNKGRQDMIMEVLDFVNKLETQYPDDDGGPFEVLACNYKKELNKRLKELK